ncbi:hypothetical protein [Curtobacterium herbarum]|uniref:hypothetical protein n=1 Tax=Curtobacterium herbarum TaxID=150122 RepID=UPI001C8EDA06|nr:hypothetical protein [Curtobacterium herbarum]MBY0176986.1 hypothetical protein [Curtobacterium herbarum]
MGERLTEALEEDRRSGTIRRGGVHHDPVVDHETVVSLLVMLEDIALSVVVPVVLERDPVLGPRHVDAAEKAPRAVVDIDVQLRLVEPRLDDRQPPPGLHRRFGADPHEFERGTSPDDVSGARCDSRSQIVDGRELAPPDDVVADCHEGSDPEQSCALEPGVRRARDAPAVQLDRHRCGDAMAEHTGPSHPDAVPDRRDVHLAAVLHSPRKRCAPEPGSSGVAEELVGRHDERDGGNELREA